MKHSRLFFLVLILVLLASACAGKGTGSPTPAPVSTASDAVVAEAHLAPERSQYIAFGAGGKVAEIKVKRGDAVKQGQVLASLADRQQPEAALAAAQLNLTSAQQAFDLLNRTSSGALAQAWAAYMDAQKVRQAARLAWDKLDQSTIQKNIDDAQSDATSRQTDLENAQKDFDKYSSLDINNATRKTYETALRTAQTNYDQAVQKLEDLTNARDRVRAALDGALAAEAEAKRTYENCQNGADVDKLALAQAALDSAKAQAAAAQNALDHYDLMAPFDGTVMEINITDNQLVSPETWVVALADTSHWYADTSDLSEMDVVKLDVGQKVQVKADALADVTMTGTIDRISLTPSSQGTDILYTVRILLETPDPRLRWGMTLEATFNPGE